MVGNALRYLLAASVIASTAGYFLLENGSANSFSTYLTTLTLLPLLTLTLTQNRQSLSIDLPLLTLVTACLIYLAATVLWSDSGESGLKHIGYAILIISFCVSIPICISHFPAFLGWFVFLTVVAATINSGYSIYLHYAMPEYQPLPEPRLFALGRLNNPVISSLSYGAASILALFAVLTERRSLAIAGYLTAMTVLLVAIVLSGSRGVYLALTIGISTGILLRYPQNLKIQVVGITLVLLLIAAIAYFFLGAELLFKRALSFRPEIWSEFLTRTIEHNVWVGAGMTTDSEFQLPELLIQHPHSVFVATFYYGGIIGLSLYLALLARTFASLRSIDSNLRLLGTMLLMFGIVATGLDGNEILTKVDYLWFLVWLPVGFAMKRNASGLS